MSLVLTPKLQVMPHFQCSEVYSPSFLWDLVETCSPGSVPAAIKERVGGHRAHPESATAWFTARGFFSKVASSVLSHACGHEAPQPGRGPCGDALHGFPLLEAGDPAECPRSQSALR